MVTKRTGHHKPSSNPPVEKQRTHWQYKYTWKKLWNATMFEVGFNKQNTGSQHSRLQYYTLRSISPDHALSSYAFKYSSPFRVSAFARASMPGLRTPRLEMTIQRDFARLIPTLRRRLVKRKPIWSDNDWVCVCESRKMTKDASAPNKMKMRESKLGERGYLEAFPQYLRADCRCVIPSIPPFCLLNRLLYLLRCLGPAPGRRFGE